MTRLAIVVLIGAVLAAILAPVAWPAVVVALAAAGVLMARATTRVVRARRATSVERLRRMTPGRFEREVGAWFARDGWVVEQRGGKGDQGLDLVAFHGERVVAVQCKRYAAGAAVTPAQVRELYGAATAIGATHAILVTTGRFSSAASTWCASLPGAPRVALVGADALAARPRSVVAWLSP